MKYSVLYYKGVKIIKRNDYDCIDIAKIEYNNPVKTECEFMSIHNNDTNVTEFIKAVKYDQDIL